MASMQVTAPPCAPSGRTGHPSRSAHREPSFGVVHHTVRHTRGFAVIGNHLAQHRALSLLAIGLAAHIQSLPSGAKIGIKRLTGRLPESEARIAAALRELETHGYLKRSGERRPNGHIVTRTARYNQPTAVPGAAVVPETETGRARRPQGPQRRPGTQGEREPSAARDRVPRAAPEPPPTPGAAPEPPPASGAAPESVRPPAPQPVREPAPDPVRVPAAETVDVRIATPDPVGDPVAAPVRVPPPPAPSGHVPTPTARKALPPPLPQPRTPTPELLRTASALLADLRRHAPQPVLTEADIRTLAGGVAAWLEREAPADTVRRAPTDLPVPLKHPAKLLRHRVTALLPGRPARRPHPGRVTHAPPPDPQPERG